MNFEHNSTIAINFLFEKWFSRFMNLLHTIRLFLRFIKLKTNYTFPSTPGCLWKCKTHKSIFQNGLLRTEWNFYWMPVFYGKLRPLFDIHYNPENGDTTLIPDTHCSGLIWLRSNLDGCCAQFYFIFSGKNLTRNYSASFHRMIAQKHA